MSLRCPTAQRAIVVAPHPDDETIGAWGLIRQLVACRARVDVVVVSDGAASHPGSASWPPVRLVRERRRETLRAMATLGIPRARVRFLQLPDGALGRCTVGLARALGRLPRAELIVGPVAGDAHADHRAVADALARVRRRGERRLGYRVWPAGSVRRGVEVALGAAGMAAKRRAVRGYRTQTGRILDAEAGCMLTARHLAMWVRPSERFELLA